MLSYLRTLFNATDAINSRRRIRTSSFLSIPYTHFLVSFRLSYALGMLSASHQIQDDSDCAMLSILMESSVTRYEKYTLSVRLNRV